MANPPRSRNDFAIAVFCALPTEAENVLSAFDVCWEDQGKSYGKLEGDQNTYTTGAIGGHNVVLIHMPSMGTTSAATSAAHLRSSFPGIKLALVVGVCGAVPVDPRTGEEILLGDIVISTAVVQYDFGRWYPRGFQRKKAVEDTLSKVNPEIRSFTSMLQTRQGRQRMVDNLSQLLHSRDFEEKFPSAVYPGASRDRLYAASYLHGHQSELSCADCDLDLGTCMKSCDELGCLDMYLASRSRQQLQVPGQAKRHIPLIHLGRFGSANTVLKSGEDRDRIANDDQLIAFEMEGAGVWEQHPTIIMKAACDYADSHKNKEWQQYAAAMAAACLKTFLRQWSVPEISAELGLDQAPKVIWYMPHERGEEFIGRKHELERLEDSLLKVNTRRIMSVLGLGGMGKTRLATELAHQIHIKQPQRSVFWVQATDRSAFEKDMLEIGKRLNIQNITDKQVDVKTLVKQRLSIASEDDWVFILDNADDEELWGKPPIEGSLDQSLVGYLPKTTYGSIIITTRTRTVATFLAGKEVINLRSLGPSQAMEMFMTGLEIPELAVDDDTALTLVERLSCLPLAIVQATSFINRTQEPASKYLEFLHQPEEEVIELLSRDFEEVSGYQKILQPVAITWVVSFNQIRKRHPLAATYLTFMACLSQSGIPISLLPKHGASRMTDALAVLVGYSFISKQAHARNVATREDLYYMHRLVHLSTRNWLRQDDQFASQTQHCLQQINSKFPTNDFRNRDKWIVYFPHAQYLSQDASNEKLPERYELLDKMAGCASRDGKFSQAVENYRAVATWKEQMMGPTDPSTLKAYSNLGGSLNGMSDYAPALQFLEKTVDMQSKASGAEDPDTLQTMHRLAMACYGQGHMAKASELAEQVLKTWRQIARDDDLDLLSCMHDFATIHRDQGQYKQAEQLNKQVLATRQKVYGAEEPLTLAAMSSLAATYNAQGRYRDAEDLQTKVVETQRRVLGEEHPDILSSMSDLASTFRDRGRHREAENLQMEVLAIKRRLLGSAHPSVLASQGELSATYIEQGRYEEAEKILKEVLQARQRVLGVDHPDTLRSTSSLALTYSKRGRFQEAEDLDTKVLEAFRTVLGAEHPETLTTACNLSCTYIERGRLGEGEVLLTEMLENGRRVFGAEHLFTLINGTNLSSLYMKQGRHQEAESLQVSLIETQRKVLGVEHPVTLGTMTRLASTYSQLWRFQEAEDLHAKTLSAHERVLGAEHPVTLEAMSSLANTYSHHGRHQEAEALQTKALEALQKVLGAEHPTTLFGMSSLAWALKRSGRNHDAKAMLSMCVELRFKVLGPTHPDYQSAARWLEIWQEEAAEAAEEGDEEKKEKRRNRKRKRRKKS